MRKPRGRTRTCRTCSGFHQCSPHAGQSIQLQDVRLSSVAVGGLRLLRAERVRVGRTVVIAGHDVRLLRAEAVPVVRSAGIKLCVFRAQAGLDDATHNIVSVRLCGKQMWRCLLVNLGTTAGRRARGSGSRCARCGGGVRGGGLGCSKASNCQDKASCEVHLCSSVCLDISTGRMLFDVANH